MNKVYIAYQEINQEKKIQIQRRGIISISMLKRNKLVVNPKLQGGIWNFDQSGVCGLPKCHVDEMSLRYE